MPVYPGDDPVSLVQNRFLDLDSYNDHRLTAGMHIGTHIDGPMHLTASSSYVADLDVESFVAPGCLLDVRGELIIHFKEKYAAMVQPGCIVLLFTGRDKLFQTPEYFTEYPQVNPGFADFLISRKIRLLGLDTPSPDYLPFTVHKALLTAGICIVENLTGLEKLVDIPNFEVIALPLKICANGSPARVIARLT